MSGTSRSLTGDTFTVDSLMETGVVRKLGDGLKILGSGELTRALHVTAHHFSESAKQKIEAAGGTVEVIAPRAKFVREKKA